MSDEPEQPLAEVVPAEEVVSDPVVENETEAPVKDENEEEKDPEEHVVLEEVVEEVDDTPKVVSKDYSKDECKLNLIY